MEWGGDRITLEESTGKGLRYTIGYDAGPIASIELRLQSSLPRRLMGKEVELIARLLLRTRLRRFGVISRSSGSLSSVKMVKGEARFKIGDPELDQFYDFYGEGTFLANLVVQESLRKALVEVMEDARNPLPLHLHSEGGWVSITLPYRKRSVAYISHLIRVLMNVLGG